MRILTASFLACTSIAVALPAVASPWTSLGRLNALQAMPDVDRCEQRIINHYWNPKFIFTPTTKSVSSSNNIGFSFSLDLRSLRFMSSNSPSLSPFKRALDFYYTVNTAKDIYASVSVGQYNSVSVEVAYADSNGLIQGRGYGVSSSELGYYELQESCPQ